MSEGRIKIEASFSKQFFPKYDGEVNDGDFAIISWKVENVLEGAPQLHPFFKTLTTKGNMCEIDRSETYTIIAKENQSEYGMQYDLIYIGQPADFSTVAAQKIFLNRILTEKQVGALFDTLDRPIEYIDRGDIETLSTVKGIGTFTAEKIIERYEEAKDYSYIYVELEGYGISNKLIQKLVETYGSPTIAVTKVKENPYILASEVNGIGFRRADEIALESGLAWDSIERVCGFIQYYLVEKAENGNSYVFANELMYGIEDELGGVDPSVIGDAMKQLTNEEDGKVGLLDIEGEPYKRVFMKKYYNLEQRVANELVRLLNGENLFEFGDWRPKVAEIEEAQGWKHTEKQYEGIQMALENQVCVVTGLAGAGKTTVVTAMLEALDAKSGKYSFSQTALSGRASAKLQEVTGEEGMTIHRLLKFNPAEGFGHNKNNPLPYDLIILDEISLVGGEIFLRLVEAIKTGSKLIMIGDDGQLESIGCMNLAKDLIESDIIPTVKLLEPHRQAKRSGIISESHKIRNHVQLFDKDFKGVEVRGDLQDFELSIVENLDETRPAMVQYFKEWFPKVGSIMDIQLLAPIRERGDCSVAKLNDDIQAIYNPPTKTKNEIEVVTNRREGKFYTLREKDKVMIMKNNYRTRNVEDREVPIFNGWIGIIEEISGCIKIHFPIINDTVLIPFTEMESVGLGYASSIHRQQGSSAPVIIGGIDYSTPPFMRTRELVYTLVTRAEKYCILVSQNPALREAIETSGVSGKCTFLKELLEDAKRNGQNQEIRLDFWEQR